MCRAAIFGPGSLLREMIIEILRICVPNGQGQELGKALASSIGPIQVQPGCLSCSVSQAWPGKDELQLEARWDSDDNLIRHLQSDIYKRLLLLIELSAAPPVVEFFTRCNSGAWIWYARHGPFLIDMR